jgi:hypothetical protein
MKNWIGLLCIIAFSGGLYAQKTVAHSDNAFTVAPIHAFDSAFTDDGIRGWFNEYLKPAFDSLDIKFSPIPGTKEGGADVKLYSKEVLIRGSHFEKYDNTFGYIEIGNDRMYVFLEASGSGLRGLDIQMKSRMPVRRFKKCLLEINYFPPNDSVKYSSTQKPGSRTFFVKIKDQKLQFDTFPAYNDTINYFRREEFNIKAKYSFTTKEFYRLEKGKAPKRCYLKGVIYFEAQRRIRNSNLDFTVDGQKLNIIKKKKNKCVCAY